MGFLIIISATPIDISGNSTYLAVSFVISIALACIPILLMVLKIGKFEGVFEERHVSLMEKLGEHSDAFKLNGVALDKPGDVGNLRTAVPGG